MSERIVDINEAAAYVKKSWRTVYRWVKRGLPVLSDGRFDLDQVDEWVSRKNGASEQDPASQPTRRVRSASSTSFEGKDYWDNESKKEQALKRRLERQKLEGELIPQKSVEDMFVARIMEVKILLLSLERLLPPELIQCRTDREMSDLIRKFTRRALAQFSRPLPPNMRSKDAADSQ